jgi:NAD-dependent DNA ligase
MTDKQWLEIPEFGERSLANIRAAIRTSKEAELWRVINSLGVPDVGIQTSKDLALHFGSLKRLAASSINDFCVTDSKGERMYVVSNIGFNIANSIVGFFQTPQAHEEVKALIAAGYDAENTNDTDCESVFVSHLNDTNKAVYIRLKKAQTILDSLKSFGIQGVDDRLLIKIVSHNKDFGVTLSERTDLLAAAIRAKTNESEIHLLLEAVRSNIGQSMISRAGAPLYANKEVFEFCQEQTLFRYKKILRLFDIGYDSTTTPDVAEKMARSFLRGEKWKAMALKLWQESQADDIYKIPIEAIEPGDAYNFESMAKQRLEEQRVLRETLKGTRIFPKKAERELDTAVKATLEPGMLSLANRLLKANSVIETVEALEIPRINSETLLRLLALRDDIFTQPLEGIAQLVESLELTPKKAESVNAIFETLNSKAIKELIEVTGAPLTADKTLHDYAVQKTAFYSIKCMILLGAPIEEQLTGHKPLELWQTAKKVDINDAELDSLTRGDALQFETEAFNRLPKKANLSDIESLKQLTSNKAGNIIVISGKVDGLNREEAKLRAEALGYKVVDSVSSAINLLVVGDDPGPAKVKKALALKIPVVSFSELKPYISA